MFSPLSHIKHPRNTAKLCGLWLVLCWLPMAQADVIEVITLKHRQASELLPLLQPLIKDDEAISGSANQLIVRAAPAQQKQIKQLLQQLDRPQHNLFITVLQDVDQQTAQQLLDADAQLTLDQDGLHPQLNARISSNRELKTRHSSQQLRVLEGHRALIQRSQQRPQTQREVIYDHRGTRVIERLSYQQANNGFYVLPQLNGQQVKLEIFAQDDQFQRHGSQLEQQHSRSTLEGKLGQWITLAQDQQQEQQQHQGLISLGNSQLSRQRLTLIKVELAD